MPKVKVETVIPPSIAELIIYKVLAEISTGNYVDGKIFIYNTENVVRIHTNECENTPL